MIYNKCFHFRIFQCYNKNSCLEQTWKSDHLRLQERKNEYTEKLLAIATKEQPERYNLGEVIF